MSSAKNKNILFTPSGSIGDSLMMLALCAEMLERDPELRVTIIARRNGRLIEDLSSAYPHIRVSVVGRGLFGMLLFLWDAFKRPYTALMPAPFGLGGLLNTTLFFRLLSLRPGTRTFGLLKKEGDADPYQKSLVFDGNVLFIDNLRRLARLAGLATKEEKSPVSLALTTEPPKTLSLPQKYIVFHPFGSSSWKSWPPRRSKELLMWLRSKYPDFSIVVTAAKENEQEAAEITDGMSGVQVVANLPMLELADVLKKSALYIGVDTGITHLAGILNHKSVILGHNSSPTWMAHYNPNAVILTNDTHCTCDGHKGGDCKVVEDGKPYLRCMYEITHEQISEAVAKVL